MQKNTQSRWQFPSQTRQQPHKTDTRRTDALGMFTCTLKILPPLPYCEVIIRVGITRSGHLDYYSIFQLNGANQHFWLMLLEKSVIKPLEYWCARTHNIETHRQHTRRTEGWDGWLTKGDITGNTSFFSFLFLFSFTCGSEYSSVGMMSVAPSE